ncbi:MULTISPECIES: hypothetical protein [unclassified Microcoleus]|nr:MULTISPECIES: hypothetical protein [unclassified Microcoleus]
MGAGAAIANPLALAFAIGTESLQLFDRPFDPFTTRSNLKN